MNTLTVNTDTILSAIDDNARLADSTKYQYRKAILNALEAGINFAEPTELATYARPLSKSSRAFLKSAVRLWAKGIELEAKAAATPDNVDAIQATTYRLEALNEAIQVEASKGDKAHTWLAQADVKRLLVTCDNTLKGQRDKVVLGLLVGAGLRRDELVNLTFEDITTQPIKGKQRTVLSVSGKGDKNRVVPISDTLAQALADWQAIAGPGRIARSVNKSGKLGKSLSAIGIFNVVRAAGELIGYPDLAPHDLRRTYAQIGFEHGILITQVSRLLGHGSVATTQRYLNLELDLDSTISDFIPFE